MHLKAGPSDVVKALAGGKSKRLEVLGEPWGLTGEVLEMD